MSLFISPKEFITKMHDNMQRLDKRINNYIIDPNVDNIHDVRTSIRRVDASFKSLPKKIRKRDKMYDYITTGKQLFKINSTIRDCDIIYEELERHASDSVLYSKLTSSLKRKKDAKIKKAKKIALSLNKMSVPRIDEGEICQKKLQQRFNKVVTKIIQRIELSFPIVITNSNKIEELHEMRKNCKKLRYMLEILPDDKKEIPSTIIELEKLQDMLGSIHDNDIVIAYLKGTRVPKADQFILKNEFLERNHKYEEFVQFCKNDLSNSKQNFFKNLISFINV